MPRLTLPVPARQRRGFTIAELLVAMVLLAIIGGAMTRVMVKQQQVYKDANRNVAARRELRLGATVLPSEFRSISSAGGDIVQMSEQQMTVRSAIGEGVICARTLGEVTVPPTNLSHHTLTSFASTPLTGDTVFLYDENAKKGSEDDRWVAFRIVDKSQSTTACPGAPYTDPALDPPASKPRLKYELQNLVVFPLGIPDSVKLGSVVKFTRLTRYKIYQETSGAWYLGMQEMQHDAWQTAVPLAGPFRTFVAGDNTPTGLQFRFYDTLGVRITDYTKVKDVGRIDVFLRTNAGRAAVTERMGAALNDSVIMRVAIRNSK